MDTNRHGWGGHHQTHQRPERDRGAAARSPVAGVRRPRPMPKPRRTKAVPKCSTILPRLSRKAETGV